MDKKKKSQSDSQDKIDEIEEVDITDIDINEINSDDQNTGKKGGVSQDKKSDIEDIGNADADADTDEDEYIPYHNDDIEDIDDEE
jgi:hypothetical protein